MARVFWAVILAIGLLPAEVLAQEGDTGSWGRVQALAQGARIEVFRKGGAGVSGTVSSVSPEAIVILTKKQQVSVARTEVTRVVTHHSGRAKWIGLAIGAGAGAGIGAAIGARLANESAGDINIKAASTAAVAAGGALIGLGDRGQFRFAALHRLPRTLKNSPAFSGISVAQQILTRFGRRRHPKNNDFAEPNSLLLPIVPVPNLSPQFPAQFGTRCALYMY